LSKQGLHLEIIPDANTDSNEDSTTDDNPDSTTDASNQASSV
jgi:hypothetical protein